MGGRKKSRVSNAPVREQQPASGGPPWILIGGLVAVAAVGGLALLSSSGGTSPLPEAESAAAESAEDDDVSRPDRPPPPPAGEPTPIPPADVELPPLPLVQNLVPRSPQVIRDAYIFAAQNPQVLEYVPCFCGCETRGHKRNADCFVQSRNPDGSVREWDTHGMACIVCIDVARDAMQMRASGARVDDIRNAVESKYAAYERQTPTPLPPVPAN
jgi:hypothetical protein